MKARIVSESWLSPTLKEATIKYAEEKVAQQRKAYLLGAIEVFVLADACVHRLEDGYGFVRLSRHILRMVKFMKFLGGYDDAAKWKCIQILEDAGLDWTEFSSMMEDLIA